MLVDTEEISPMKITSEAKKDKVKADRIEDSYTIVTYIKTKRRR